MQKKAIVEKKFLKGGEPGGLVIHLEFSCPITVEIQQRVFTFFTPLTKPGNIHYAWDLKGKKVAVTLLMKIQKEFLYRRLLDLLPRETVVRIEE